MKKIKDIENMDWEALEQAAEAGQTKVPEDLDARIKTAILASEVLAEKQSAHKRLPARVFYGFAFAAALAAVIAVGVSRQRPLQDTFDDPYLAYAEVEKTFRQISNKMNVGLELAAEARTTAEKPAEILKKINE